MLVLGTNFVGNMVTHTRSDNTIPPPTPYAGSSSFVIESSDVADGSGHAKRPVELLPISRVALLAFIFGIVVRRGSACIGQEHNP